MTPEVLLKAMFQAAVAAANVGYGPEAMERLISD